MKYFKPGDEVTLITFHDKITGIVVRTPSMNDYWVIESGDLLIQVVGHDVRMATRKNVRLIEEKPSKPLFFNNIREVISAFKRK